VAFVPFGAEAAPITDFDESDAGRQTNRAEPSMTRVRLRRYFRHGMLPQLMAFEACVRHGSVTRAAEELSLAQPTVSCLIRKLSETLGAPVTEMRDRRIAPTAVGRELLVLCREVLGSFERFDAKRLAALPANDADAGAAGYDRRGETEGSDRWLSLSRPIDPSRSKPRA
jgi:hypothetical protein